jgi:large subunit ribosomal protein L16
VEDKLAKEALRLASFKLPMKTSILERERLGGEPNES